MTRRVSLKTQNSKLKTQNSKLKTQNSKLKTQNSKLKTQNSSPRIAATMLPTLWDDSNTRPTGIPPGSWTRPMELRPAEAMQPHCEQSGFPPNWHGVTFV